MKEIVQSRAFQRDLRKLAKRGKNLSKLYAVVEYLAKDMPLAAKHNAHGDTFGFVLAASQ